MASTSASAQVELRGGFKAYRDLRTARKRHYLNQIDWIEALYRAYVAAIFGGIALALLAGAINDVDVTHQGVNDIARHGPALMGLLAAVAAAAGIRSGGRGGPLAIEAADVQYVLLSPVDRGKVLRGLTVRQLRRAAFAGAVTGLIVANFAFRRLPGSTVSWLVSLAVFGASVTVLAVASAAVASGRRLHRPSIDLLATLVIGWSAADFLLDVKTSPATMLGELALWPLHRTGESPVLPAVGLGVVVVMAILALRGVGGTSLEAARRRAGLTSQLRFAVTVQDLRAVILLRRQLAGEVPRRAPWLRLPRSGGARLAVWDRDWQSFLRWPGVRVGRVVVLGAVTGLALCGTWEGTTPLVAVAGLAIFLAGLDAIEPLAQEIDHPTRGELLPIPASRLLRRHLAAPTVLLIAPVAVAAGTSLLVGARPSLVLEIAVAMAFPTALVASLAAALSTTNDPFAHVLNPGITAALNGAPPALTVLGVSGPFLAARAAEGHGGVVAAVVSSEVGVALVCVGIVFWLGRRVEARAPVRT
jgi:hypothetical protein